MIQTLEHLCVNETKTLAYTPGRVPFIVHNYNTESNAVTVWAPKELNYSLALPRILIPRTGLNS